MRDVKERRSRLLKYIPDVSRSVYGILEGMRKRKLDEEEGVDRIASPRKRQPGMSPAKRTKTRDSEVQTIITDLTEGSLTVDTIKQNLLEAVELTANMGDVGGEMGANSKSGKDDDDRQELYLVPIYDEPKDIKHVIQHPLFSFFPTNMIS